MHVNMYIGMHAGESIPVSKVPLPSASDGGEHTLYNTELHKSHTLFCGTHVIQTRAETVRALVIRTGFDTAKGELVRSIMFPKPAQYVLLRNSFLEFDWLHSSLLSLDRFNDQRALAACGGLLILILIGWLCVHRFRFYSDSYKFIGLLAVLGLGGFIYSVVILLRNGMPDGEVVVRGFDLVTTVRAARHACVNMH